MINLNEVEIKTDGNEESRQRDHSTRVGPFQVFFKDLEGQLVERIKRAEVVVGCVAWMTNPKILTAIADRPAGASIIVQKEDFLRPDGDSNKRRLRAQYGSIRKLHRPQCRPLLSSMSTCCDPEMEAVRCVGVCPERGVTSPKMHHKFLVFGTISIPPANCVQDELDSEGIVKPYAVWTGSFNFTHNATRSFENAVYIEDARIAQAYFEEFQQVAAFGEPLDWDSEYVEPEWRVGT